MGTFCCREIFVHLECTKIKRSKYFLQQIIKERKFYGLKVTRARVLAAIWRCQRSSIIYGVRRSRANKREAMSVLKLQNGLPDPKGPLSLSLPSQAIALANSEVAKASDKRGQYKK